MNEAELLFTGILNCNRLSLYLDKDKILDQAKTSFVSEALKRRMRGEPLQYILGSTEFMGLKFKVTPDVFIPRPETEILVETILKIVSMLECLNVRMLDIGTGSGCIAISLAKFIPNAQVTAIDVSDTALEIATQNAILNNISDKITFINSDLFTSYELRVTSYDIIICNPPYIKSGQLQSLAPEVKKEPQNALDGGRDGLTFYRQILKEAPHYLKKKGFVFFEFSPEVANGVRRIFAKTFGNIRIIKDHAGLKRVIFGQWTNY